MSPVAMVWPCPLLVDAHVAAGREVGFPRPACPSCAGPLVLWSGYWRHVRAGGRCQKIFVSRLRCGRCLVSYALLPAFALAWRLDVAETVGAVIAEVAGGRCGVRPAAARRAVPYTTARGWGAGPAGRRAATRTPHGSSRRYSRGTIDRWLRAWRKGGLEALRPSPRLTRGWCALTWSCSPRPRLCAWSCPAGRPRRSPRSFFHRHGIAVSERTIRGQLRRAGLHREALAAEPKAYGRYQAARPNERWITDVLVGPWVPFPGREGSARARLFLIVDDHSRLLVNGRFFAHENARACQELLRRAITRRGLPEVSIVIMPTRGLGRSRCEGSAHRG